MADDLDMKLNVDVKVDGTEKIEKLRTQEFGRIEAELLAVARAAKAAASGVASLGKGKQGTGTDGARDAREALNVDRERFAELKRTWSFQRRMASQARAEQGEAARAVREQQAETERNFRAQLAFNTRIAAQRAKAESDAEREIRREIAETTRMRDRANRQAVADARRLEREQHRALAAAAAGAGRVRSGAGRAVAVGGATGIGLAYGAERAVDALTRSGAQVDAALNANIRLGGLSPKDAEAKGVEIRKRAMPIARSLGIRTSEYLKGRAEAIQAGVDDEILDTVTEFGSKYARLNDMSSSEVMESSGYGITALGAFGKVTADKVKQLFNIQQHLAATTAASRQGLNSFVKRGLSAGAAAGFSIDDTLAYGGAATSSGADGEMAARMLSSTTERLASMPTKAADIGRKKQKSHKDRNILSLPRKLGFRDWREVKAAFSVDAAGTMEKLYEGLATVHDPRERLELSEELWGKEFGAVHAAMAVGHRFRDMRKSVRSPQAGGAIDNGMAVRAGSYDFILDQIGATITDLKDSLGLVLKPLWSDLRDWALKSPQAFQEFENAFRMGLRGFMQGLGSRDGTMAGLLRTWFGDPGTFKLNAYGIGEFARGVGTGLREVGNAIVSFLRLFAGQNASPAELGRWTAKILGFSAALLVAAPAIAVLGAIGTAITGFAAVITSTWALLKAAGLVGAASGAPKVPTGPGAAATEGWMARLGKLLGIAAFAPTASLNKADQDKLLGRLGGYAQQLEQQRKAAGGGWVDPPMRKPVEELKESLNETVEALRDGAKLQRQSLDDADFRSLIHPASFGSAANAISGSIRSTAGRAAGLSGSVGGGSIGGGSPLSGATPGGSIAGLSGMRTRGIMGGGYSGGSVAPAGSAARNFAGLAPKIMADLQKDFGLDKESAAAILGNLGHESAGMTAFQEGNPRGGGRGGWGWAQWTGPRRRQFEAWAAQRGLDPKSYEANYGFLKHELSGEYKGSIDAVKGATGLDQKTIAFENSYERAGVKHYDRRIGYARTAMGLDGNSSGGGSAGGSSNGPGGNPVDAASRYLGMGEHNNRAAVERFVGGNIAGRANAWCASFVNASLNAVGQKGTGSNIANSFLRWGNAISAEMVQKGDVLVEHRGKGVNAPGGHVGLATGNKRMRNGQLELEVLSGNSSDQVQTGWEKASTLAARRAADAVSTFKENARAAGTVNVPAGQADGARNAFGGVNPMGGGGAGLGTSAPIRRAPVGSGGGAGAGGGQTVQNVTINGSHLSPQEMSAAVQRALGQSMDRRTHDVDGYA